MSLDAMMQALTTDKERVEHLKLRLKLSEDIDAIKEQCFTEHKDLNATLDVIFKCITKHVCPAAIFLQTRNEELEMTLYTHGITKELFLQKVPELLSISKPTKQSTPLLNW